MCRRQLFRAGEDFGNLAVRSPAIVEAFDRRKAAFGNGLLQPIPGVLDRHDMHRLRRADEALCTIRAVIGTLRPVLAVPKKPLHGLYRLDAFGTRETDAPSPIAFAKTHFMLHCRGTDTTRLPVATIVRDRAQTHGQ